MTLAIFSPEVGNHAATDVSVPVEEQEPTVVDQYNIVVSAIGPVVVRPNLYFAAGRKRAEVYIDEKHFLGEEARRRDGTEADEDDARSVHVVVNNGGVSGRETNVVGVMRLIEKRDEDDLLPAERFFNIPAAPVGSIESSRFMAKDEDKGLQHRVALALIRAATLRGLANGSPYVYAVVEEPLFRHFKAIGLPFEAVTDLEWVEEYKTYNRVIRAVPSEAIPALRQRDIERGGVAVAPFFEKDIETLGFGQYDANF